MFLVFYADSLNLMRTLLASSADHESSTNFTELFDGVSRYTQNPISRIFKGLKTTNGDDKRQNKIHDEASNEKAPLNCIPEQKHAAFPIPAGDDDAPFWKAWKCLRLKAIELIKDNEEYEATIFLFIQLSFISVVSYCTLQL